MLIDTHAHYDDAAFDEDRKQLISFLKEENIIAIDAGASMKSTAKAVELALEYDNIYALAGVHPDDVADLSDDDMQQLIEYTGNSKVVGIGEIGLDYHWDDVPRDVQKKWFIKQLDIAKQTRMPVCIHSRDAAQDTLDIIRNYSDGLSGAVMHCYSYGVDLAKEYLKLGFFFGIGGVVTFKNGKKMKEVVEFLPIESIVLETDCPYLAPEPNRGRRNSSLYLNYVADAIAQIKGISAEQVIEITEQNARRLYRKIK